MAVVVIATVGAGGYYGMGLMERSGQNDPTDPPDPVDPVDTVPVEPPPPRPDPVIAATEGAVRERAQERFLTSTQTLFRDLAPIPEIWLQGAYLALPSDYPEVREAWERYVTTIREVRVGDSERYRVAYERALDDAVIEGEARTTRWTSAAADFAAAAPRRAAHYDRVETLALSAISTHDALVEAEGLLIYDPTAPTGLSAEIGSGVSGRDADAELLLARIREVVGAALDADGLGPGDGASVREWVWGGLLDAVAN